MAIRIEKPALKSSIYSIEIDGHKMTSSPWVIGEYKWTKQNVSMPNGWSKVDIPIGLTLKTGTNDNFDNGYVGTHSHKIGYDYDTQDRYVGTNTGSGLGMSKYVSGGGKSWIGWFTDDASNWGYVSETRSTGGDKNYAAGLNAVLWVYVGFTETGETNVELANQWNAEMNHNYKVQMDLH